MHTKSLVGTLKGRNYFGNLGGEGRIILELIPKKQGVRVWAGLIRIRNKGGLF
jgi:hypothetical protein